MRALGKEPAIRMLVPVGPLLCWVVWSKLANLRAALQHPENSQELIHVRSEEESHNEAHAEFLC